MKKTVALLLAVLMVFSLAACGQKTEAPAATQAPVTEAAPVEQAAAPAGYNDDLSDQAFGGAVKYDPAKPVNNGEPITIDYWLWTSDAIWQSVMDEYMAIHPNVTINIINNPFEDYFVKLPVALSGKDGPALFNMHPTYMNLISSFIAPYDIPLEDLKADFNGVDGRVVDGGVPFLDLGYMTGSIFYNKAYWAEAGLTEADIPKTWEEFFEVAKKLTVKDETGKITRAGWNSQGYVNTYILGLNYQQGQPLISEDGKTAYVNNEASVKTMNMLLDAYNSGDISSKDFTDESLVNFVTGQTAMVFAWGWLNDFLVVNAPDLDFGVFEVPLYDTSDFAAYNMLTSESIFAVNGNASAEQQAVAQDIVRFFLANDQAQIQANLGYSTFPAKKSLVNNEQIMTNKALSCIKDHFDQYIYPGTLPSTFETNLKIMEQDVFYNGMAVEDALKKAEDAINADLAMG